VGGERREGGISTERGQGQAGGVAVTGYKEWDIHHAYEYCHYYDWMVAEIYGFEHPG
jgi:hypothetical protein